MMNIVASSLSYGPAHLGMDRNQRHVAVSCSSQLLKVFL